jgi:hypothetical protein
MKQLRYSHALVESLLGALSRRVALTLRSQIVPRIRRLIPGRRGRRLAAGLCLFVSLVVQAFLIYLTAELVELCIDLYEVWAILARKYVELD